MRVLIISHGHPGFSIGGAEGASHNLFRAINAAGEGHEAFYLARATPPVRRHTDTPLLALRQGAREVFLHADAWEPFWLSNGALDDLSGAFANYVTYLNPDVVHFHHVIGLGVEALLQVRRLLPNAAIVFTFHEYLFICVNHGQMVKTNRNTLCRRASPADCAACFPQHSAGGIFQRELFLKDHLALADIFVSPSRFLIERYVEGGLPAERFRFVENGLDTDAPTPPRTVAASGRRNRFGFFGQVTEFKGLLVLLDAVSRIPRNIWGDASLSLFGGNQENQPVAFREQFARHLQIVGRRVKFFGSYRPEELPRLMGQVDWIIVPSIWWENSPLVIQEAFLHRRPLIVSDIGGMAEKVEHGVTGLHFRSASPEDLADRMVEALNSSDLWDRLSAAAPRPPSLNEFANQHLDIYRETLARRRGRAVPSGPSDQGKSGGQGAKSASWLERLMTTKAEAK
jgi:glycosyltransferase involved in cell wall biosynthesis